MCVRTEAAVNAVVGVLLYRLPGREEGLQRQLGIMRLLAVSGSWTLVSIGRSPPPWIAVKRKACLILSVELVVLRTSIPNATVWLPVHTVVELFRAR